MNTFTRIAIIASIATFAGCEAPANDGSPADQVSGQASSSDMGASIEEAPAAVAFGQVNDEHGIALVGATICIEDGNTCVISDEDGTWEIKGIQSGMSEMLEVDADGYIPTVVPFDVVDKDIWVDVSMTRNGTMAMAGGEGAVRLVDVSVPSAVGPKKAPQVRFSRDANPAGQQSMALSKRASIAVMDAGIAQASIEQMVPETPCRIVLGFQGPGENSAVVPVVAGKVTQVAVNCAIRHR